MVKKIEKKGDDSKTIAIVSYITVIGWIVALILNNNNKKELASFHIRQSLMLMLAWLVFSWIPFLSIPLMIVVFIFWIIGLVAAIEGKKKEVPIIGSLAQDWFRSL